jgi:methylglutaconyl-CoA hydratase
MPYSTLQLEREGAVTTLTLARPEKRNAISTQMIEELLAALDDVEASSARAVILTGAGKAFCAGMDLEGLQATAAMSPAQHLEDSRRAAVFFRRLHTFPKPLIAAVNGPAIAGGCGIATLADFTLAAPEAKFGYPEVKIGFAPAIVSVFLRRQIGEKAVRDLLLTGRIIDATEASRLGLVTEIVPSEKLIVRAKEIAGLLLAASPEAVARTKRLLLRYDEAALDAEIEIAVRENAAIRSTADFREGISSFLEKRAPKWAGD